ncbi:MAG TPA: hypothetical protein PK114_06850, partial [Smithellaceae bacterium]|nr:hypothetical protein [Smithellaceae bacterium]
MFVNVALNIPADKLFTYEVPAVLRTEITVGKRVFVPFGSRRRTGFVVEIINSCRLAKIRSIIEVLDEDPLFGETDFRFYRWIADYFMYPLGKTLAEIIPAGSEKKDFLWVTPLASAAAITLPAEQKNIFELLRQYPQGITVDSLAKISGRRNISRILDRLHLAGLL